MKRKIPSLDKRYSKHRPVSDEEAQLWLESMKDPARAVPVKLGVRPAEQQVSPAPAKKSRSAEVPLLDRITSAKIRRGTLTIDATLDLHGHTRDTAFAELARFILWARGRALRTVLVITGKGTGGTTGILRERLPDWLNAPALRGHITGYGPADARHGGSGAWYLRLRKKKKND